MRKAILEGIATLCLLTACAIELRRGIILQKPWAGFDASSLPLSYLLIASALAAIAGLWTARALSNFALVMGIFVVLAEGLMLAPTLDLVPSLTFTGLAVAAAASAFCARYPGMVAAKETKVEIPKKRARAA